MFKIKAGDYSINSLVEKSRSVYEQYELGSMPEGMKRNSLKHYYLSIYPSIGAMDNRVGTTPSYPTEVNSVYVHMPYCSGTCDFCSYVTVPVKIKKNHGGLVDIEDTVVTSVGHDAIKKYFEHLKQEIRLHKKHTKFNVSYIYFGGGSPNLIPLTVLIDFFEFLMRENFFSKNFYGTFELHPEIFNDMNVARLFLETIFKYGITRVSIGYQFSDDDMLKKTKRRHASTFIGNAISLIREVGLIFNLDLMYGLPEQGLHAWGESLVSALSYEPDSISTYFLFLNEGTPLQRRVAEGSVLLPSYEECQRQKIMAVYLFRECGYLELPNDFFCKVENAEFEKFTQTMLPSDSHTLPLGVGSYGFMNGLQYCNQFNLDSYFHSIQNEKIPIWRGASLSETGLLRRDIMFSFKNSPYIDLTLLNRKYSKNIISEIDRIFIFLTSLKLIKIEAEKIYLTDKGKLCVEEIACLFFQTKDFRMKNDDDDSEIINKHVFSPQYPSFEDFFPSNSNSNSNNTRTSWSNMMLRQTTPQSKGEDLKVKLT